MVAGALSIGPSIVLCVIVVHSYSGRGWQRWKKRDFF